MLRRVPLVYELRANKRDGVSLGVFDFLHGARRNDPLIGDTVGETYCRGRAAFGTLTVRVPAVYRRNVFSC
jgi:hypothetical protein